MWRNRFGRGFGPVVSQITDDDDDDDYMLHIYIYIYYMCGPANSVGIVTDYGLDGPGSNPGGDEIFRPSSGARSASCKMGTGSFPGGKVWPGRAANHSPPSSAAVMEE